MIIYGLDYRFLTGPSRGQRKRSMGSAKTTKVMYCTTLNIKQGILGPPIVSIDTLGPRGNIFDFLGVHGVKKV
jgi:hypothetical protein